MCQEKTGGKGPGSAEDGQKDGEQDCPVFLGVCLEYFESHIDGSVLFLVKEFLLYLNLLKFLGLMQVFGLGHRLAHVFQRGVFFPAVVALLLGRGHVERIDRVFYTR